MDAKKYKIEGRQLDDVRDIAVREGREEEAVVRLLVAFGIRAYRIKRSLLCGFRGCTRKDCCGGTVGGTPAGLLVKFEKGTDG